MEIKLNNKGSHVHGKSDRHNIKYQNPSYICSQSNYNCKKFITIVHQ